MPFFSSCIQQDSLRNVLNLESPKSHAEPPTKSRVIVPYASKMAAFLSTPPSGSVLVLSRGPAPYKPIASPFQRVKIPPVVINGDYDLIILFFLKQRISKNDNQKIAHRNI